MYAGAFNASRSYFFISPVTFIYSEDGRSVGVTRECFGRVAWDKFLNEKEGKRAEAQRLDLRADGGPECGQGLIRLVVAGSTEFSMTQNMKMSVGWGNMAGPLVHNHW